MHARPPVPNDDGGYVDDGFGFVGSTPTRRLLPAIHHRHGICPFAFASATGTANQYGRSSSLHRVNNRGGRSGGSAYRPGRDTRFHVLKWFTSRGTPYSRGAAGRGHTASTSSPAASVPRGRRRAPPARGEAPECRGNSGWRALSRTAAPLRASSAARATVLRP